MGYSLIAEYYENTNKVTIKMSNKDGIKNELIFYTVPLKPGTPIPFAEGQVSAGFPSPSDNYLEGELDLNSLLINNPPATFFVRANGDSMIDAGINTGDILIVDKSLEPVNRDIVIAVLDGEFTLKRLLIKKDHIILQPENKNYAPIKIDDDRNFEIWGVVTNIIHTVRK